MSLTRLARRAVVAALGLVTALVLAMPAQTASATSGPAFGAAVTVPPSGVSGNPAQSYLLAVSCTGNRSCLAGGTFTDPAGVEHATLAIQAGPVWTPQAVLTMPSDATPDQIAVVNGVSCLRAGRCVAVGSYMSVTGNEQPFVASESNGAWSAATSPKLPGSAPWQGAALHAVSCTGFGICQAVGSYLDKAGQSHPMVVTRSVFGHWGPVRRLGLPPDAVQGLTANLNGISCGGIGDCVAVGAYDGPAGKKAMVMTEAGGFWKVTGIAPPPGRLDTALNAISCATPGNCLAVGFTEAPGTHQSAGVSVAVRWGHAGPATLINALPPGTGSPSSLMLDGVSCVLAGSCVAAGLVQGGGLFQLTTAVALTWTGGTWNAATITQPADAATGPGQFSQLAGVSCTGNTHCTAVGDYQGTSTGSGTPREAEATSTG
jgi:hypothetical protein